jgi:hypothetical protein
VCVWELSFSYLIGFHFSNVMTQIVVWLDSPAGHYVSFPPSQIPPCFLDTPQSGGRDLLCFLQSNSSASTKPCFWGWRKERIMFSQCTCFLSLGFVFRSFNYLVRLILLFCLWAVDIGVLYRYSIVDFRQTAMFCDTLFSTKYRQIAAIAAL